MKKAWVKVLLLVLVIVIGIGLFGGYRFTRQGLPVTSGEITAPVSSRVEIYRDDYGVPHIIAATIEDLFFAHGYAQAQDRLWQMDMNRRGVGGRLAEVIGEDGVDTDIFTLTVGFRRAAENNYRLLSPEGKVHLAAYAAGVNAYIDHNRKNLPQEFTLLGYEPEPWEPVDSLLIAVFMAWYLGGNMDTELFHSVLIEKAGLDLALEIFPDYPDYGPVIAPTVGGEPAFSSGDVDKLINLSRIAELGGRTTYVPGLGSNNWVISGELTPGKGAFMANDMHLAMGLPSIWHSAHLVLEGQFNVAGAMFPGIPGIIAGYNEHLAWGFTNTGPDVQDLYLLELNPDDPTQYLYEGTWQDAEMISAEFFVKGEEEPRTFEAMVTRFGPEISGVVDLEAPLCLRWTALDGSREFDAVLGMMQATNWDEFTAAMENFMVPTQNVVYADREGNIGYRANGLIPIRNAGSGLLPADGTTSEYEWTGYIDWPELPTLYNPPEGIIVTANHRVIDDDYPYFISSQWAPPYRAMGIWRELGEKESYDFEDMIRAQTSFYNTHAETLAPVLIKALEGKDFNEAEEEAFEIFRDWLAEPIDLADAAGPAIYNALYMNLLQNTFLDEMGEDLFERFLHNRASTNSFDRMLLSGRSGWFNNINTAQSETRDEIILLSFIDVVAELENALGGKPSTWQWGELHTITFRHNMGAVALLAHFYNRGPYPIGGGFHTPANMSYQMVDPYGATHSAPWRLIVNMDTREAIEASAIGVSGHPFSDHYDDQAELWLEGNYKEVIFEVEAVRSLPELLVLKP